MKKILLIILAIITSFCFSFGQKTDTVRPYYGGFEKLENYPYDSVPRIKNAWLPNGQQIIFNGNGYREYEMWGEIRRYYYRDGSVSGLVLFMDTTKTRLTQIGNFLGNEEDGQWMTFHKNGQISSQVEFDSGKVVSNMTLYYENAKLRAEYPVNNQREPIGSYVEYFESGALKNKGQFALMVCDLKWEDLENDSQEHLEDNSPKSIRVGKWLEYYEDGAVKRDYEYERYCFFTEEGDSTDFGGYMSWLITHECPSGKWIEYDESGEIIKVTAYKNCEEIKN